MLFLNPGWAKQYEQLVTPPAEPPETEGLPYSERHRELQAPTGQGTVSA